MLANQSKIRVIVLNDIFSESAKIGPYEFINIHAGERSTRLEFRIKI